MENLATLTLRIGQGDEAWLRYREAFGLYASVDDEQGMVCALAGLIFSSQSSEQQRLAAVLLGHLAIPRESQDQFEAPDLSPRERELRAALGDINFQTAWEEGYHLTVPEISERIATAARENAELVRR